MRNETLLAQVSDAIRHTLGGRAPRDAGIDIEPDGAEAIALRRPIGFEWREVNGHDRDPRTIRRRFREGARTASIRLEAQRFAERADALTRREQAIKGHLGEYLDPPPWSLLIDPLLLHLVGLGQWSPGDLARPQRYNSGFKVDVTGYRTGPAEMVHRQGDWTLTVSELGINAGVLSARNATVARKGRTVAIWSAVAAPTLTAPGLDLPETLIAAMAGRRLNEAIGHPAFAEATMRIVSASHAVSADGGVKLRLERRVTPLAPLPAGIEAPWRDTLARLAWR